MATMGVIRHHHRKNSGFVDTGGRGYECKTCRKRFNSYQALGGHQGIHKKQVVNYKPAIDDDDEKEIINLRLDILRPNGVHRCKQCMKEFETGQALGGHMRRHRQATADQKASVLMQQMMINEEDVVIRRQLQASEKEGKSDLMMETEEEVSRFIKADDDDCYRRRCELILAAREWRLCI